jgi:hypothetical protein
MISESENASSAESGPEDILEEGAEERIGYSSPPKASRFKPGQSGNPHGKARGTRNLTSIVATALNARVNVKENGRRRSISKLEAALAQLANRAASGDHKATQLLIALVRANDEPRSNVVGNNFDAADQLVMSELARRMTVDSEGGNS